MNSCENCGSIRVVRARSTFFDRAVRVFTGRRPFVCRRCGWRARREWATAPTAHPQLTTRSDADQDELKALDTFTEGPPAGQTTQLDLTEIDAIATADVAVSAADSAAPGRVRSRKRRRSHRIGRRDTFGTLALAVAAILVMVILALSASL